MAGLGRLGSKIAGGVSNITDKALGKAISKVDILEMQEARKEKALRENIANIPTYEIPQEAKDYLALLSQTSEQLGETAKPYEEAVEIARNKAGMGEAPGSTLAREDIRQSAAQQIQNIKEAGGGGIGALGAVAQVGGTEQQALRDLAKTNLEYQDQADTNLQNALMGQSQFQGSLLQQQAALKGAGLQSMVGEKEKVYQSNLDKYLTMTELELNKLGLSKVDIENAKVAAAQKKAALGNFAIKIFGSMFGK